MTKKAWPLTRITSAEMMKIMKNNEMQTHSYNTTIVLFNLKINKTRFIANYKKAPISALSALTPDLEATI